MPALDVWFYFGRSDPAGITILLVARDHWTGKVTLRTPYEHIPFDRANPRLDLLRTRLKEDSVWTDALRMELLL